MITIGVIWLSLPNGLSINNCAIFLASMPAAQANTMKAQYESSKQQFASMPVAAQDKACNQAAEQLKQMKAAMSK